MAKKIGRSPEPTVSAQLLTKFMINRIYLFLSALRNTLSKQASLPPPILLTVRVEPHDFRTSQLFKLYYLKQRSGRNIR